MTLVVVVVPPNTTAAVHLPTDPRRHVFACASGKAA
ncbi:hypothetical protein ACIBI9_19990 [Nonomuraea sp. NPDC050451]